ncbi:carboxylesterase family domain-containing protein [Pochonia chlamydosporia 170]|uniref:Carboxylesterase family domain-containing protein n=1 Tax=Pochonia chlamydosporia 170 TaxID=1380566 RepID=A0A179FVH0_METCM|nr:carboxylesterase family domain-containing protein [Pochonia chlamydosporia 170]OAQ69612.1 carboxylesterase family domain-containing protein [Pochonia chlamydosporia 170]
MKFNSQRLHVCILLFGTALDQAAGSQDQSPTVRIGAGYVIGSACPDSPADLFQRIPYAQPPVKQLRFLPPVAFNGTYSRGVFQATKAPAPCIQFGPYSTRVPPSEDW